jgi:hypothetical protein
MMVGSMVQRLYSGASGGIQREGKVMPKSGIKAGEIGWQKVVQTASAQS